MSYLLHIIVHYDRELFCRLKLLLNTFIHAYEFLIIVKMNSLYFELRDNQVTLHADVHSFMYVK